MCRRPDQVSEPQTGTRRRTFLRTTGLVGAGVAITGLEATPAGAAEPAAEQAPAWRPDADSPRFTVAVMPDTQYLFDGESIHPAPVEASFRYLLSRAREENIVFLSHLGDLTEHGQPAEFGPVGRAFRLLDERGAAYS
ncbi:Tat pathway signal sequence domain protein, partial [Streptomyces sp. MCAF7]